MANKSLLLLLALACFQTGHAASTLPNPADERASGAVTTTTLDTAGEKNEATEGKDTDWRKDKEWKRRHYFNITYGSSDLDMKKAPVQSFDASDMSFKSKLNIGIQAGRSISLHKKPIANTLKFYLNFTPFDLSISRYDKSAYGGLPEGMYDSDASYTLDSDSYTDYAWNLSKLRVQYGMHLGPSVTVHPFGTFSNRAAHFLSLNIYFQVGYNATMLAMNSDKEADIRRQEGLPQTNQGIDMEKDFKGNWGHGLSTKFGLSLSWKAIGLGFETVSNNLNFRMLNSYLYSKQSYSMKNSTKFFYLSFRY